MIAKDSTYVVMGILNTDSIAYATGRLIETLGGKVIWTAQNERMKKIFFDRGCKDLSEEVKSSMDFRYCDVTVKEEVEALFASTGRLMAFYIRLHMPTQRRVWVRGALYRCNGRCVAGLSY